MGVKDVQLISDKQWLAGIRDIIELHKYGRADEVRTVHRLASTCEERYQKALEYLEEKRGQQGEPAGARGKKERGQQGEPAGASKGGGGRREDSRGTWFSRPLAPPKVVTLGNTQINLVFLSLIRNFAP
ncbi:MAG: hypothetical protein MR893_00625 [Prevotellaceae bacterium]|nr:hypothetical protein [Prevotellaceae bacterium]